MTCRGIWQRVYVQNLKGHRGGKGRWNSHIRLCYSFQVETYFCFKELITLTVFAFALTRYILVGWRTRSHFTQQTSSSLRGSWSSTHRKYGICFTWSFSWTQIQMSDCPVEVNKSTSLTVFQMLPQTVWKNTKQYFFWLSLQFCETWAEAETWSRFSHSTQRLSNLLLRSFVCL